jgi:hypothetical protein
VKLFSLNGDEAACEHAVSLYVNLARTREESIETVPATPVTALRRQEPDNHFARRWLF